METQDYNAVLDSLDSTGIYVVRADNHEILYCNKKVKDIIPNAREGMICHELWQGSCQCCPLIGIEGKDRNRSFNYDGPGHRATDITATRVMWGGTVPAFVVTFTPHVEPSNSTYEKIVKGNLTTNACEAIKMTDQERAMLPPYGFTLTMALDSFVHGGLLFDEDVDRFVKFSSLPNMSREFKSGKKCIVCNYRRLTKRGVRWNTMEVVPDVDYSDDNQAVMIYVKDVQDIYREGLEYESINLKNEAILKALGGENFGIFLVTLATGKTECIRSRTEDRQILSDAHNSWNDIVDEFSQNRYRAESRIKLKEGFSLDALRAMGKDHKERRELLLERKINGVWHYVSATAYYHVGTADRMYAIVAFQDVDAHIRKELDLIRDEKRMAAVIRSSYSMMNFLDLATGMCERVFLKDTGEEITSSGDYREYIMRAAETAVYPADRDTFLKSLSFDSLSEKAKTTKSHREDIVRYRIADEKKIRWVEQHIFYMPGEKNVDIAIFGRDITADKLREEEEMRAAREKAHIVNSLNAMFLSTGYIDLERNVLKRVVQRGAVADMLGDGHDYADVMGRYAERFVHPDDRAEYLEAISRDTVISKLTDKHPVTACEFREKPDKDGNCRWVRANIVLAEKEDGKPSVALYVAQDITESKRKEEKDRAILQDALETANFANTSKSEFLSRMSHDIRTPMNAIIGMTAIAGTHLDDKDRVADCLGKITISGRHLLSLINEVLDLSKIESGRVDLSEEEFVLPTFFDELNTLVLPTIQAKEQNFEFRMENIRHERVIGDSLRLQQVFMNILSNAVKYTPAHGKIEMNVREEASTISGYSHYEFVFRDSGIGMSEDYVKHIFEPFTRDESSGSGEVEGTGLGMAIARNIVQMMNGDISVKSKAGKGSEFTVSLFLKICDSKDDEVKELVDLPVLVADDDEDSCLTTCNVLDEMGMKSEYVISGREAVIKVTDAHNEDNDYFAVILDWKMPGMDGIETARQIRAAVGPDVPIIILSAYDWGDVEEEARAAGVNGFISKPLFRSRLVYLFRQFVGSEDKEESGSAELLDMKKHDYSGKKILLVEDNNLNREIATEIIGMTGVDIECAINGRDAVQMFEKSPLGYYDLIFMDIRMPVMNGHEATRTIRALRREDAKTVPIVAMSANAFTSDISASKQAGMNEHIIKPLNFKSLMQCMERWLNKPKTA